MKQALAATEAGHTLRSLLLDAERVDRTIKGVLRRRSVARAGTRWSRGSRA